MSFDEQPDGDPHGECAAEIHRLEKERDLLFDALNLHMRSTGITNEAMDRVDAFRAVIANAEPQVRGECTRLSAGWNNAAKELSAERALREAAERDKNEVVEICAIEIEERMKAESERDALKAELTQAREFVSAAFLAHPNLDIDIEVARAGEEGKSD